MVNSNDFHYDLPDEAVAKHPVEPRRAARMLVRSKDGTLEDASFEHLPKALQSAGVDGLWANDTKVLHARILATKSTGGQLEVFLLAPIQGTAEQSLTRTDSVEWKAMVRNAKRWSDGTATAKGDRFLLNLERMDETADGVRCVRLTWTAHEPGLQGATFAEVLDDLGKTPLPPYMKRPAEGQDRTDYQTVFALAPGSVAAPTAGLHYDDDLLASLSAVGCPLNRLTLHVGAGTFKPLSDGEIMAHDMHAERCVLTREAVERLARQSMRVATGTTTLRTLESLYWWSWHHRSTGEWVDVVPQRIPYSDSAANAGAWTDRDALNHVLEHGPWSATGEVTFETQLMVVPGYRIRMVKGLVTNFHQPGSTLLCLVGAFVGMHAWKDMYEHALESGYRFLSYGDGCLLWLVDALEAE